MMLSVIMPVYNGEQYLKEAIESVLNQTYRDFELIIINDGSTDRSADIIEHYASKDSRIVYVNQENRGLAKTLNVGLILANGRYIARMDADDICLPNRFEEQIKYLQLHPAVKLLGTAVELIDKDGGKVCVDVPYTGSEFLKSFMFKVGNPFKHPTIIACTETVKECGGFNELIGKYFEDYFLWSKIAQKHKVDILPKVLLKYRITPGSIMSSIKSREFSDFMLKIINKGFFTEDDRLEMIDIKEREKTDISDIKTTYLKRLNSAKSLKVNRFFRMSSAVIGDKLAMPISVFMKKVLLSYFY